MLLHETRYRVIHTSIGTFHRHRIFESYFPTNPSLSPEGEWCFNRGQAEKREEKVCKNCVSSYVRQAIAIIFHVSYHLVTPRLSLQIVLMML